MANYFARKAANINAADIWATTAGGSAADVFSTFTSSDVLHSNSFAVTVNVDTTVAEVRNDNANSATNGGSFALLNGITLTANVIAGSSVSCVTFNLTSGNSASIVGNCTGGSANNAFGADNQNTGTLNITGNLTAGGASPSSGARNSSTGTLNVTGNVAGGTSAAAVGLQNSSTGTVTLTGNATGGSSVASIAAGNNSTGTMTIVGSAIGGNNGIGASNVSTGILNVKRAVGNDWGIGATGMISVVGVNSANVGSQTRVEEFEFGLLGQAPVTGAVSCPDQTTNVCLVHRLSSTKKTLIDPSASTGQANEADVRSGTSYALGNKTGTLAVPAAGSVALGVAVDATTGTAVLTPAAVWDALTSGMTTSGSIGARLKNAATLDSTGQQLADALSPVP
jgi:fibronectin-binding autotransporter adhesin